MSQLLMPNFQRSDAYAGHRRVCPNFSALQTSAVRHGFVACPTLGFILALVLTHFLVLRLTLSLAVELVCAGAAVTGLLGTALFVKILTGEDGFVFYRDAITALILVATVLRLIHQPVLPYLDVTILGAGLFQAFGRVGCLLVGCCYGRPARFGVRYTHTHAQTGFPSYLVGVRLFPIQAVEALCVIAFVFAGCATLLSTHPPAAGYVTACYALAYASARFVIEFFRGDVARPIYADFSQAQWISLILSTAIACAERFAVFPATTWHFLIPVLIAAWMLAVTTYRHFSKQTSFELTKPNHVRELADFLARQSQPSMTNELALPVAPARIPMVSTSAGLRLSSTELFMHDCSVLAVTLSRTGPPLTRAQARRITETLSRLGSFASGYELRAASPGVFHALFPYPH